MFRGKYHGKKKHDGELFQTSSKSYTTHLRDSTDDFNAMIERSRAAGVKSMIITGGSLRESEQALKLARENSQFPGTTLAGYRSLIPFFAQISMQLSAAIQRGLPSLTSFKAVLKHI